MSRALDPVPAHGDRRPAAMPEGDLTLDEIQVNFETSSTTPPPPSAGRNGNGDDADNTGGCDSGSNSLVGGGSSSSNTAAGGPPGEWTILTPFGTFAVGRRIGRGAFAFVYRALWTENGFFVAVKKFDTSQMSKETVDSVLTEINLLGRLKHPNILRILGYHNERETLYLMLEYAENGSLFNIVKEFGRLSESVVKMYVRQVLSALEYLHACGVIHRDLKAANILLMKSGDVKLADFGVAAVMGECDKHFTIVGSPYWMAPEVISAVGHSTQSDIWSLGCTIIELLTGEPPYFGLNPMSAMFKIVQSPAQIPTDVVGPELKDLLQLCFQKDPTRRPSASMLLQHQWFFSASSGADGASSGPPAFAGVPPPRYSADSSLPGKHGTDPASTSTGSGGAHHHGKRDPKRRSLNTSSLRNPAPAPMVAVSSPKKSLGAVARMPAPTLATRARSRSGTVVEDPFATHSRGAPRTTSPDGDNSEDEGSSGGRGHSDEIKKAILDLQLAAATVPELPPSARSEEAAASGSSSPVVKATGSALSPVKDEMAREIEDLKRRILEIEGLKTAANSKTRFVVAPKEQLRGRVVSHVPANSTACSMLAVDQSVWVGSNEGVVTVYGGPNMAVTATVKVHNYRVLSMTTVGSNKIWCSSEDGQVYVLSSTNPSGESVRRTALHDIEHKSIKCLMFLPPCSDSSGRHSSKSHGRVWSCATNQRDSHVVVANRRGQVKFKLKVQQPIYCMAVKEGTHPLVYFGCSSGTVYVCDANQGNFLRELRIPLSNANTVVNSVLHCGDILWVSVGRHLQLLDAEREYRVLQTISLTKPSAESVLAERLVQFENLVLVGKSNSTVDCFDIVDNFRLVNTIECSALSTPSLNGKVSPVPMKSIAIVTAPGGSTAASSSCLSQQIWIGSPCSSKMYVCHS